MVAVECILRKGLFGIFKRTRRLFLSPVENIPAHLQWLLVYVGVHHGGEGGREVGRLCDEGITLVIWDFLLYRK